MNNYFFVDGSSLIADTCKIQEKPEFKNKKLVLKKFVNEFCSSRLHRFHSGSYTRFVFYFVNGDERVNRTLILPKFNVPDENDDIEIRYCGKSSHNLKELINGLINTILHIMF